MEIHCQTHEEADAVRIELDHFGYQILPETSGNVVATTAPRKVVEVIVKMLCAQPPTIMAESWED